MFQRKLHSANSDFLIIPKKNRKDVAKILDEIKNGVEIRPVSDADEVLTIA